MAVVRERRLPALTLNLPDSAADCRRRFPLPPLPPPPVPSTSSSAPAPASASASAAEYRLSDLDKLCVLGHGNGGTVYKVRHRRTAAVYALKVLHDPSDPRAAGREAAILRRAADHAGIIRLHSVIPTTAGGAALLLEHADAGSLDGLLRRPGLRPIPEPALASVARQVLLGLAHLRSVKIVHRDLKPANLLINRHGEIKIADFGAGKLLGRTLEPCASYVGTCAYMSPERLDPGAHGGAYDAYAADVWSLGLVLMELGLGRFPLLPAGQRLDWAALVCAVCLGDPPAPPPETASPEFADFVGRCLQRDAGKRWSVAELLAHPFVAARDAGEADRALRELVDES